jgi:hypothetical protein
VELFILVPLSLIFIAAGIAGFFNDKIGWGAFGALSGVGLLLFALGSMKETLQGNSDVPTILDHDISRKINLTEREKRFLKQIADEVRNAPDIDTVRKVLGNKESLIKTSNEQLQPLAFALRPTTRKQYLIGIVLETITWSAVLLMMPLLLSIALIDAAVAWDGGKATLYKAMRFSRGARRYRIRPHNVLLHRKESPILYLRAFSEEYANSIDSFFPTTPEEKLVSQCNRFGPVIAVGNPTDEIPLLGASRLYFNEHWQECVLYLISVSRLVIIHAGFTKGLLWELGVARKFCAGSKVAITFIAWEDLELSSRRIAYLRFRNYVAVAFELQLPADLDRDVFITFDDDWKPASGKRLDSLQLTQKS